MVQRWREALLLLGGMALAGCALLPGVPAGPSHGPSLRASVTTAAAYGPSTARLRNPSGSSQREGNAAQYNGGVLVPFPQRLAARFSTGPWLDVGADIGWLDRGLQLRAGPLQASRSLPGGLELEWCSGSASVVADDEVVERAQVLRARVELYPPLRVGASPEGAPRAFGVLAAGVSQGRQLLSLSNTGASVPFISSYSRAEGTNALRTETRLELAIGLHWADLPVQATFVLLPWFTVHRRNAELVCNDCVNVELERLTANWGMALAIDGGLLFRTTE